MAEYIKREAALNFRLTVRLRPEELTAAQAVAEAIMEHIKAIPAADVAPVVRCKDCKLYVPEDTLANEAYMCTLDADWDEKDNCYYGFTSYPSKDFFCAGGQRKEQK